MGCPFACADRIVPSEESRPLSDIRIDLSVVGRYIDAKAY